MARLPMFSVMNRELIRDSLRAPGPAIVRTSDGKEYPVPHPEFVFIGRHNVVIEKQNGGIDILDPLHIVSIRPAPRRKPHKESK